MPVGMNIIMYNHVADIWTTRWLFMGEGVKIQDAMQKSLLDSRECWVSIISKQGKPCLEFYAYMQPRNYAAHKMQSYLDSSKVKNTCSVNISCMMK